jgi:predicted transcriptional regulator of viral defense system
MPTLDQLPAGTFRQSDAARAGINARLLYRLRDAGKIEAISRGLYRRTDAPPGDIDLIEITIRARHATICLASALARHGLIDAIPARTDIAIPRGQTAPITTAPAMWHQFNRATFDLGRDIIVIEGSDQAIGLYGPERSIADAFRLRGTEGYELATEALRAWLGRRGSQPAHLMEMAIRLPRAQQPIRQALEYLT